jgi:alpha-galactosidase
MKKNILVQNDDKILLESEWIPPCIEDIKSIPKGDMPGDKIEINSLHITKAQIIFPRLLELIISVLNTYPDQRVVVAVHGGSGVGKSEIGALLSYYLNDIKIGSYVLSGDNYPHRIPKHNDAERLRVFRENGLKGLVYSGVYTEERNKILKTLQESFQDVDPDACKEHQWISAYQAAGRNGLKSYLGSLLEIDFNELNQIITNFKNGDEKLMLKRMGREESEVWYDSVDFSDKKVMIIEWTHGNNTNLQNVDIPVLLNSTPQETLEHRKLRNRDGAIDSPFTSMVLHIEQELLFSQASKAKIIVTKSGEIVSYDTYLELMGQE